MLRCIRILEIYIHRLDVDSMWKILFFLSSRFIQSKREVEKYLYIYICTRESIYSYNDISIENNIDVAKSSRKDKKSKKFRLVKLI